MTYNKWFPDRPDAPRRQSLHERRALSVRLAWYVSTLMLVSGYVLMFVLWGR